MKIRRNSGHDRRERKGALLSIELLFVIPILLGLIFAIVEFGLIWSANVQVKSASRLACRVATLPGADLDEIREAARRGMAKPHLAQLLRLRVEGGEHTGDLVGVEVRVPMSAATPDFLSMIGFGLSGHELVGRTVMRKE